MAIYLAQAGFDILPKNYSQAATLVKIYNQEVGYYEERPALERAWKNILATNDPTEITTYRINAEIDPDWDEKQSLKLPKALLDRAKKIAKSKGITVREYLTDLMDVDEEGDDIGAIITHEFSDEQSQIFDDRVREHSAISDRFLLDIESITKPLVDEIYRQILKIFSLNRGLEPEGIGLAADRVKTGDESRM